MDNRPIGVFDSGLGGLTSAEKLRLTMPGEDLVYFGDTYRMPYGGRSYDEIMTIASRTLISCRDSRSRP
jgi:glutamate racemase